MNNKIQKINEGRAIGYTTGILSGIPGSVPGYLAGNYFARKKNAIDVERGKIKHPDMQYGSRLRSEILGGIPLVGSISNVLAAKSYYDAKEKLKKEKNNRK